MNTIKRLAGWIVRGGTVIVIVMHAVVVPAWGMDGGKSLTVTLRNVRSDKGHILLMMQDEWQERTLGSLMVKAKQGRMELRLETKTEGKGILSVFHDENDDGQLNTDERGIPVEGCYRNKVQPGPASINVHLYYPRSDGQE